MAVDMFLKLGDLKGESVDAKHKDEIDVLSWSWGLSQQGTTHLGGGGGAGKVSVSDLSFTKYVDKASPNLFQYCCSGKHFPSATLIIRKAGDTPLEYMKVTMEDVIIASVQAGASGGDDRLTENISINFGRVKVSYQPQKADGSPDGGSIDAGWNIATNEVYK